MTRCITGIFVKTQFERFLKAAKHRILKDSGGGDSRGQGGGVQVSIYYLVRWERGGLRQAGYLRPRASIVKELANLSFP